MVEPESTINMEQISIKGISWEKQGKDAELVIEPVFPNSTNMEPIFIKGTSWEREEHLVKGKDEEHLVKGKDEDYLVLKGRDEEHLVETFRDRRVEPELLALLAELESESPALEQLPCVDLWGSYSDCTCQDGECNHRGEWEWVVRLRLLTAIGRCRTLETICLNPRRRGIHSVRQEEALALLSGLQHNLVLQELDLYGYQSFVTTPACLLALTSVIEKSSRSLELLDLRYAGLSAQGLGDIAAVFRRNAHGGSVLSNLRLNGNDIGNAVGAQHLADILTNLPTLRRLRIRNIGMDEEGAVQEDGAIPRFEDGAAAFLCQPPPQ